MVAGGSARLECGCIHRIWGRFGGGREWSVGVDGSDGNCSSV